MGACHVQHARRRARRRRARRRTVTEQLAHGREEDAATGGRERGGGADLVRVVCLLQGRARTRDARRAEDQGPVGGGDRRRRGGRDLEAACRRVPLRLRRRAGHARLRRWQRAARRARGSAALRRGCRRRAADADAQGQGRQEGAHARHGDLRPARAARQGRRPARRQADVQAGARGGGRAHLLDQRPRRAARARGAAGRGWDRRRRLDPSGRGG